MSKTPTTADLRPGDVVATVPDPYRRQGGVQRAGDSTLPTVVWRTVSDVSAVTASVRRVSFTDGTDVSTWLDKPWFRQPVSEQQCRHCGEAIRADGHGSWIDGTDGDGCDPGVHEPHDYTRDYSEDRPTY